MLTAAAATEEDLADALTTLGALVPTPASILAAYIDLHRRLRKTFVNNFAALTKADTYVDTFRPEQWRRQAPRTVPLQSSSQGPFVGGH